MTGPATSSPVWSGLPAAVARPAREALHAHGAAEGAGWSEGARRFLRAGALFLTVSADPDDAPRLAHEVAARRAVGHAGVLRAPQPVASGEGWHLCRAVDAVPLAEVPPDVVARAVAAVGRLVLPERPPQADPPPSPPWRRAAQQAALLRSPLPLADVVAARRWRESAPGPEVTVHGDLHTGNVLASAEALHVLDWELADRGPAGLDLGRLVARLPVAHGDLVLEAAAGLPGSPPLAVLRGHRYAETVRTAADLWLAPRGQGRDRPAARALAARLPGLRRAAGL